MELNAQQPRVATRSPNRPASRRLALAALSVVALAACGSTPDEAPAAGAEAPAAGAEAPAGTAAAATPAGRAQDRISMAECTTPAEGRVHFRVGDSVLAVPAPDVREVIPVGMKAPLQQEAVTTELRALAAEGAGCPEKPMDAALLLLGGNASNPLLEGTIGVLRSPPGTITAQFAELTRNLQRSPTQNCRQLNGQLIACVGTETIGPRETPVMYVITTDPNRTLNTGGPLAARCVLDGEAIRGCNIVDQLPGNLTMDAALNAGTYSTESLASAHQAALARVQSLRR
jgi:hypothetical protein